MVNGEQDKREHRLKILEAGNEATKEGTTAVAVPLASGLTRGQC